MLNARSFQKNFALHLDIVLERAINLNFAYSFLLSIDGEMGFGSFIQREFSFIRGNYLILVVSWVLMAIGMENTAVAIGFQSFSSQRTLKNSLVTGKPFSVSLISQIFPGN